MLRDAGRTCLVVVLKTFSLSPRPYFLAACFPDLVQGIPGIHVATSTRGIQPSLLQLSEPYPSMVLFQYSHCPAYYISNDSRDRLMDASEGWPSAHAALTFTVAMFMGLWILGKKIQSRTWASTAWEGVRPYSNTGLGFGWLLLLMSPFIPAIFVSTSVWVDYVRSSPFLWPCFRIS
jgi:membrane-associated phospholipid phosphatase